MPTTATLTPATRRRLAEIVLRAGGFLTPTEARLRDRLLPAIAAEDPELARVLRGYLVVG